MRRLPAMVAETPVGATVDVTVWRRDGEKKVRVTVGELEDEQLAAASPTATPPQANPKDLQSLGLALGTITPELRNRFALDEATKGVVITEVKNGSPRAAKGPPAGGVIVEGGKRGGATPDGAEEREGKDNTGRCP